jgi:hypothetical protein
MSVDSDTISEGDSPAPAPGRLRRWIMNLSVGTIVTTSCALLLALIALREGGVFSLQLCSKNFEEQYNASWSTPAGWTPPALDGVQMLFADEAGEDSLASASKGGPRARTVYVHVDDYDIDGLHWLPLCKWGGCDYSVRVYIDEESWGTLEGHVDLRMTGLASHRDFEDELREQIRGTITKNLEKWAKR